MMKKSKLFGWAIMALASLSACTDNAGDVLAGENEIRLTSEITPSRVTSLDYQSTQIVPGQEVGITITGAKAAHKNVAWRVGEDGVLTNTGDPVFWANEDVVITAYHPYNSAWTGTSHEFSVSTDQSDNTNYRNSDLLWAMTTSSMTKTAIPLVFEHKLAKVNVTLRSEDIDDLSGAVVSICGTNVATSFNPTTGSLSATSTDVQEIKAGETTSSAYTASAIVVPQMVANGTKFIKIVLGDKTFYYTLSTDKELRAGYSHNYMLTIKDMDVTAESDKITDWEDEDNEGDAENEVATIPNNQIWYTSSDGNIITNYNTSAFGINIKSNVYENGKGIITFDNDLTTIGTNAFNFCSSLINITIPNSVDSIGPGAFAGCLSLKEFKGKYASDGGRCLVKNNVILSYADASGSEFTIPENVTTIAAGSFIGCSSLETITIPNSVKTIQPMAFICPNLKTINGKYASEDSRCYIIDGKLCMIAPAGLTEYTIPDNVETIAAYSFNGGFRLQSVTIPNSVTTIENYAFESCPALTSVFCKAEAPPAAVNPWESNNWSLGYVADDCKIYVPVGYCDQYRKASRWNNYAEDIVAFDYDKGEIVISNNIIYYTSSDGKIVEPYEKDAFGSKIISNTYENGLGMIKFEGDVISIGLNAFKFCNKLTSITIPNSVIEVESIAFYDCYNLKEFKGRYASDDGSCLIIDGMLAAYAEASGTEYHIPNNVTVIGGHVFDGFSNLEQIEIPNGVKTIGYGAFQSCQSLTSITIPNSVTEIKSQAFFWCFNLTNVTLGSGVTRIDASAFQSCNITSLTVPNNVETIGRGAFQYCGNLTNVTIGNSVSEIDREAFDGCYSLTNITIPSSVTKIGNDAFANCSNLINVYCKPETPPTAFCWYNENWEAFNSNAEGRKIYVPKDYGNIYKAADGWKDYAADIVEYNF